LRVVSKNFFTHPFLFYCTNPDLEQISIYIYMKSRSLGMSGFSGNRLRFENLSQVLLPKSSILGMFVSSCRAEQRWNNIGKRRICVIGWVYNSIILRKWKMSDCWWSSILLKLGANFAKPVLKKKYEKIPSLWALLFFSRE
jgi:hypothetical protein